MVLVSPCEGSEPDLPKLSTLQSTHVNCKKRSQESSRKQSSVSYGIAVRKISDHGTETIHCCSQGKRHPVRTPQVLPPHITLVSGQWMGCRKKPVCPLGPVSTVSYVHRHLPLDPSWATCRVTIVSPLSYYHSWRSAPSSPPFSYATETIYEQCYCIESFLGDHL